MTHSKEIASNQFWNWRITWTWMHISFFCVCVGTHSSQKHGVFNLELMVHEHIIFWCCVVFLNVACSTIWHYHREWQNQPMSSYISDPFTIRCIYLSKQRKKDLIHTDLCSICYFCSKMFLNVYMLISINY